MKTLNRTLSLVLVLVMVLGLFGVASAKFTDDETIQYKEAVGVVSGIGAINGYPDGSFGPTGSITREEAAKLITYAILGPDLAATLKVSGTDFTDVDAGRWSAPFISYLVGKGIINGMGDGTFDPTGKVTGYQIAKMLLTAAGYGKNGEYTGGSWELNTAVDAGRAGIFTGSKATNHAAPATREEAALYVYNGLTKVGQVTYSKLLEEYSTPGNTIAKDVYKLEAKIAGRVTGATTAAGVTTMTTDAVNLTGITAVPGLKYSPSLNLYGHVVKAFYNTETMAVYHVEDLSTSVTASPNMTADAFDKALGTNVDWANSTTVGDFDNYAYVPAGFDSSTAIGTFVPVSGTKYVVYDSEVVSVVNPTAYTLEAVTAIGTTAGSETITIGSTVLQNNATDDNVDEYEGIAVGDYVIAVTIGGKTTLTEVQTVEGKITKKAGNTLTIDGVDYALNNTGDNTGISDDATDFTNTFKLYLTAAGEYFAVTKVTDESVASDIVYATATYTSSSYDSFGVLTTKTFAQTVALDGTVGAVLVGVKVGSAAQQGVDTLSAGLYTFKLSSTPADATAGIHTATGVTAADAGGAIITGAVKQAQGTIAQDVTFTTTKISLDAADITTVNAKAYLTANTKFVFVDGTLAALKVESFTGPINYVLDVSETSVESVILSKDAQGNLIVDAVIIGGTYSDPGQVSTDYLFIAAQTTPAQTADGYLFEVYNAAGQKTTITASNTTVATAGLYSYTVVNGVYTLNAKATGTTFDEYTFASRFGTRISATNGATALTDAEAANAVIVDVDATAGTKVTSVTSFVSTTKFFAVVGENNTVVAIFVTDRA